MSEQTTKELLEERATHYGAPEDNFARIAKGWSAIFGCEVSLVQVALAMDWLKSSRLIATPDHRDSWLDKHGYSAIGEALSRRRDDT